MLHQENIQYCCIKQIVKYSQYLNYIIFYFMKNTSNQDLKQKILDDDEINVSHPSATGTHQLAQQHVEIGQFIKSAVYGGLDGLITTFNIAFSAFASGKDTSKIINTVISLGISSLLADGLAMGIADLIATQSDSQFTTSEKQRQQEEIDKDFDMEKEQMVEIYKNMGLQEENSKEIVNILAQNEKGFLQVMMVEELGLVSGEQNPFQNSLVTFFAFGIFGLMPLLPFVIAKAANLGWNKDFVIISAVLTVFFLFVLGFSKSLIVLSKWYYSSSEAIFIGFLSAAAAFGMGSLLHAGAG